MLMVCEEGLPSRVMISRAADRLAFSAGPPAARKTSQTVGVVAKV